MIVSEEKIHLLYLANKNSVIITPRNGNFATKNQFYK
jgi:hypothetical protein